MCGEALVAGFALGRVIYAEERRDAEERVDEFALSARARLAAGFPLGRVIYAEERRGAEERVDEFALGGRTDGHRWPTTLCIAYSPWQITYDGDDLPVVAEVSCAPAPAGS